MTPAGGLACAGCGWAPERGRPLAFRCGAGVPGDDVDHVLGLVDDAAGERLASDGDENPFIRFRRHLHSWRVAREAGLGDAAYVALVRDLDARIAAVDGHGFRITPCERSAPLGEALGLGRGGLWVKDETVNVSGSHKARHLMGLAIHLAIGARLGDASSRGPLAIASCGNAALAAAVVAKALGRALDVYVPPGANAAVLGRLQALGAHVVPCPRDPALPAGDPCVHRFREAVARGAIPFSCQGTDNGLTIDGGRTLGWELVLQHASVSRRPLDRVVVQVGGGALLSSVAQALRVAHRCGSLARLPRIHSVQAEGGHPLDGAWRTVARAIAAQLAREGAPPPATPGESKLAAFIHTHASAALLDAHLRDAARHRSRHMRPWPQEPRSAAGGILDDETYDWLAIVRAMLETGGWPVVATEDAILSSREQGARATGIDADATGTAGLAGVLELQAAGALAADENVAVLFTGRRRDRK